VPRIVQRLSHRDIGPTQQQTNKNNNKKKGKEDKNTRGNDLSGFIKLQSRLKFPSLSSRNRK
jgi:hypothetical protein